MCMQARALCSPTSRQPSHGAVYALACQEDRWSEARVSHSTESVSSIMYQCRQSGHAAVAAMLATQTLVPEDSACHLR